MSLFAICIALFDSVRFVIPAFSDDIVMLAPVSNITLVVGKLEE